jgi:hypothetical protein
MKESEISLSWPAQLCDWLIITMKHNKTKQNTFSKEVKSLITQTNHKSCLS